MHTDAEERHAELEHTLQCHLTTLKNQEELVQELEGKVKRDRVKFIAWTTRIQELEDELLREKAQVHKINGQINVLSEQICHCNAPAVTNSSFAYQDRTTLQ
jgi:chromosome segregation ATPase